MNTSAFSDLFLPVTLAVITFGVGLSITFRDIRNIVLLPRNILVGLLSQLLVLPLIAFGIALAGAFSDQIASLGIVMIALGGLFMISKMH